MTTLSSRSMMKLINIALSSTLFIYGLILFIIGKLTHVAFPSAPTQIVYVIALMSPVLVLVSLIFYRTKVARMGDDGGRQTLSILCLALNEMCAVFGFVAVFLNDDGNGYIYVANAFAALVGNVLMFPRD